MEFKIAGWLAGFGLLLTAAPALAEAPLEQQIIPLTDEVFSVVEGDILASTTCALLEQRPGGDNYTLSKETGVELLELYQRSLVLDYQTGENVEFYIFHPTLGTAQVICSPALRYTGVARVALMLDPYQGAPSIVLYIQNNDGEELGISVRGELAVVEDLMNPDFPQDLAPWVYQLLETPQFATVYVNPYTLGLVNPPELPEFGI